MNNPRQTVTFTAPLYAFLTEEARRLGISVSDLIRRVLDEWREKQQK